jgi:SAM-dependent methyltransferase
MMFGFRDEFEYIECSACGCLQIRDIPANLSTYYPASYYSFHQKNNSESLLIHPLRAFLKRQRMKYFLHDKRFLGWLISKFSRTRFDYKWSWLKKVGVQPEDAILDVGCGAGHLLARLQVHGFSNLTGVDPFIGGDIIQDKIRIYKKELTEMEGEFDFILFNHSFEHMSQPLAILRSVQRLLKPQRYALLRIPVASSLAWKHYGVNWGQLDAPRHLFLHTPKSIKLLADQAHLQLVDIIYDSYEFQFWVSEQYARDIPLLDSRSYVNDPQAFTRQEIAAFKDQAAELNRRGEGDQASFYLYKL